MENIYKKLNQAINYIEKELFEEKDYKKICQLLELNTALANSIFELFTGYTIKDYIRKRRLSEAVFMIQKEKIIDVAIESGYNTREGFSRAFKAFHGVNPSEKFDNFNYLEQIKFEETLPSYPPIKVKIIEFKNKTLYFTNQLINEGYILTKLFGNKIITKYASESKEDNADFIQLNGRFFESEVPLKSYQFADIEILNNGNKKYLYSY